MLYGIGSVYGSARVGLLKAVYHLRGVGIIGTTLAEIPRGLTNALFMIAMELFNIQSIPEIEVA